MLVMSVMQEYIEVVLDQVWLQSIKHVFCDLLISDQIFE